MVGAKRLDKKWLAASKEIKAQQGSKGFLGTHSFLKYPFHGAQRKQHRRPFSACGVGDTSTFHLCKIVPVVRSIQGCVIKQDYVFGPSDQWSILVAHWSFLDKPFWRERGRREKPTKAPRSMTAQLRLQGARHRWLRGHCRPRQPFPTSVHRFEVNLRLCYCLFLGGIIFRFH
jgi:hypothetical protein